MLKHYISKRSTVGPYVTIKHQQKSMYGESICVNTFDLSDLERSVSMLLSFCKLISHKEAVLDHMLLIRQYQETIYGQSIDSVTFDLRQDHSHFEALQLVKEASQAICYYQTLIMLIGSIYGEYIAEITLTLVILKGQCQGHSDFKGLYLVKEPIYAMCYY